MNKTVKTIAWICLVLGLLGVAADTGIYLRGRMRTAEIQEAIASGEMPALGRRFTDNDEKSDGGTGDKNGARPNRGERFDLGEKGGGIRAFDRGGLNRDRRGVFALPLFFLLAGPVLLVIGAVMLIVNRGPKQKEEKAKEKTKAKSTPKTKTTKS